MCMVKNIKNVFLSLCLGILLLSGSFARADSPQLAALESEIDTGFTLPDILDAKNLGLYKKIFKLQDKGRWKKADRLIAQLSDRTLLGHVEVQRYLHPTAYRSRYKELRRWLSKYRDHPQAKRVYDLAVRRKPKNALNPARPNRTYLSGSGHDGTGVGKTYRARKKLTKKQARKAASYTRTMRHYTRKGWTKSVKRLLRTKEVHQLLHAGQIDRARTWLAAGYYADGRDEWAYSWAQKSIKRSGQYLPMAHWIAGLASWRLDKLERAAKHFEKVAVSEYSSDWMISASTYWAARSYLRVGKPQKVNELLAQSALYPRTFYGLLANRALGYETVFDWTLPDLQEAGVLSLRLNPHGRRALALLQLDQDEMAEKEFRSGYAKMDGFARTAMMAIALRTNMASFTMRLAGVLTRNGEKVPDAAYFPQPHWQPANGFKVDRALIFALMRQESGFNPKAKSYAGAKGLMQLMPRTASFVARDRRFRWSKKLFEPETNIKLGQNYIQMLLNEKSVRGDLFHLAAAWNGGPGNLNKWKRAVKHQNDPLLFIESIPSRETRIFIERVLTNFWIYRDQMGQEASTLDAIASGAWPTYKSQEHRLIEVAKAKK